MKNIIQEAHSKARAKRLAFVRKEYNKGVSQVEIARKLGITKQRVGVLVREAGLK